VIFVVANVDQAESKESTSLVAACSESLCRRLCSTGSSLLSVSCMLEIVFEKLHTFVPLAFLQNANTGCSGKTVPALSFLKPVLILA
jgi:hypothetical protein